MPAKNDITGDEIKSKSNSQLFEENFERIFGKKEKSKNTDWDEKRVDIVGQNGNDGLHYDK